MRLNERQKLLLEVCLVHANYEVNLTAVYVYDKSFVILFGVTKSVAMQKKVDDFLKYQFFKPVFIGFWI